MRGMRSSGSGVEIKSVYVYFSAWVRTGMYLHAFVCVLYLPKTKDF